MRQDTSVAASRSAARLPRRTPTPPRLTPTSPRLMPPPPRVTPTPPRLMPTPPVATSSTHRLTQRGAQRLRSEGDVLVRVRRREEARLERRRRQEHAAPERRLEEAPEQRGVRLLRVLEAADGTLHEVDAPHPAERAARRREPERARLLQDR